jgi:hypothetical protein
LTYEEIEQLGGKAVVTYPKIPMNDVWEEISLSQAKERLAESGGIMSDLERKRPFDKSKYESARFLKMDLGGGLRVAGENGRWFITVDPQNGRAFVAVTKGSPE